MASMARSSAIAGPLAGPKLYEEYCGCEFTLQPKLVADIVDRLEAIEPNAEVLYEPDSAFFKIRGTRAQIQLIGRTLDDVLGTELIGDYKARGLLDDLKLMEPTELVQNFTDYQVVTRDNETEEKAIEDAYGWYCFPRHLRHFQFRAIWKKLENEDLQVKASDFFTSADAKELQKATGCESSYNLSGLRVYLGCHTPEGTAKAKKILEVLYKYHLIAKYCARPAGSILALRAQPDNHTFWSEHITRSRLSVRYMELVDHHLVVSTLWPGSVVMGNGDLERYETLYQTGATVRLCTFDAVVRRYVPEVLPAVTAAVTRNQSKGIDTEFDDWFKVSRFPGSAMKSEFASLVLEAKDMPVKPAPTTPSPTSRVPRLPPQPNLLTERILTWAGEVTDLIDLSDANDPYRRSFHTSGRAESVASMPRPLDLLTGSRLYRPSLLDEPGRPLDTVKPLTPLVAGALTPVVETSLPVHVESPVAESAHEGSEAGTVVPGDFAAESSRTPTRPTAAMSVKSASGSSSSEASFFSAQENVLMDGGTDTDDLQSDLNLPDLGCVMERAQIDHAQGHVEHTSNDKYSEANLEPINVGAEAEGSNSATKYAQGKVKHGHKTEDDKDHTEDDKDQTEDDKDQVEHDRANLEFDGNVKDEGRLKHKSIHSQSEISFIPTEQENPGFDLTEGFSNAPKVPEEQYSYSGPLEEWRPAVKLPVPTTPKQPVILGGKEDPLDGVNLISFGSGRNSPVAGASTGKNLRPDLLVDSPHLGLLNSMSPALIPTRPSPSVRSQTGNALASTSRDVRLFPKSPASAEPEAEPEAEKIIVRVASDDELDRRVFHSTMNQMAPSRKQRGRGQPRKYQAPPNRFTMPSPIPQVNSNLIRAFGDPPQMERHKTGFGQLIYYVMAPLGAWSGRIELKFHVGRIILRHMSLDVLSFNDIESAQGGNDAEMFLKYLRGCRKSAMFTPVVSLLKHDMAYMAGLGHLSGEPMWTRESKCVVYEITGKLESEKRFFTVEITQEESSINTHEAAFSYRVRYNNDGFGAVFVHCARRNWDLKAEVHVNPEAKLQEAYGALAAEMARSLEVDFSRFVDSFGCTDLPTLSFHADEKYRFSPVRFLTRRIVRYSFNPRTEFDELPTKPMSKGKGPARSGSSDPFDPVAIHKPFKATEGSLVLRDGLVENASSPSSSTTMPPTRQQGSDDYFDDTAADADEAGGPSSAHPSEPPRNTDDAKGKSPAGPEPPAGVYMDIAEVHRMDLQPVVSLSLPPHLRAWKAFPPSNSGSPTSTYLAGGPPPRISAASWGPGSARPQNTDGGDGGDRGASAPVDAATGSPRRWYEASLGSALLDGRLAENRGLAYGSEASGWNGESIQRSAALGELHAAAERLVMRIDGVGHRNNNLLEGAFKPPGGGKPGIEPW